jgi:hypothetical protein
MAFTFGRDATGKFSSKKPGDSDESAGVDSAPVGEGPGAAAVGDARLEAKEGLEKRGRGRPRKDGTVNRVADKPSAAKSAASNIPPEVREQLEAMYSPEVWEPVVDLPFAGMQLYTGHEHWGLDEKSKRVLSLSISTAARYMGFTNPKWLAINLFLINLAAVTAPRFLQEIALRKLEQAQAAKKPPIPPPVAPHETGGP